MRSVLQMMFAIMVDEITDCSYHEQWAVCISFCISQLEINEAFVGLYEFEKQDAATLLKVALDVLLRLQLEIEHCRVQCYDGPANIAGHLHELLLEFWIKFVHFAVHTINLVVQVAISFAPMFRDSVHMFGNLVNFVRDSPKRFHIFKNLQVAKWQIVKAFFSHKMGAAWVLTNCTAVHEFTK